MTPVVNLVVSLGMLVTVPLGLRLLPVVGTDRAARLSPVFAVPGVVALRLPRGALSTTLACWYGVGTLLLAALAVGHAWNCLSCKAFRATDAAAVTAQVCPAIAAFALVSERASTEVFGFSLTILALPCHTSRSRGWRGPMDWRTPSASPSAPSWPSPG